MNLVKTAHKLSLGKTARSLRSGRRGLAWGSLVLSLLLWVVIMCATILTANLPLNTWIFSLTMPAYAFVGTLIFVHHPGNRIGRLCLLIGWLLFPAFLGLDQWAALSFFNIESLAPFIIRISLTLMQILVMLIFVYVPLLFPNGQYLTRNWMRFGKWFATLMALPVLLTLIQPGNIFDWGQGQELNIINPLAVNWPWLADIPQLTLLYVWVIPTLLAILVAIGSLVLRWRRSDEQAGQQIKWVVYFLSIIVASSMVLEMFIWLFWSVLLGTAVYNAIEIVYSYLITIAWVGFPLVIGLAVLKYRLYDIDIIINRTLVYGGLSLGIVAIYVVVVGVLGSLFQAQDNYLYVLLVTALIAVLFQPVREWLQRGVNRLMFGERDDPYAVLSKLSTKLQTTVTPQAMLQSVVETIITSLKLPYAAVELVDEQGRLNAAKKGGVIGDVVELPLRYQNETIGYLVVSTRSAGEAFTEREQRLLADIAAQTGAVASSVRLMAALQQSREKLVLNREEERRRIRRDLHDGLGPTLATQTFTMDAILKRLETDPQEAAYLLHDLKTQNKEIVADIRRLVYELRPSVLDELGLLDALKTHVAQINNSQSLQISVTADPDPLPVLSAAVEVAAYRIVLEAITNVVRHAGAKHCRVHLKVSENGRSYLQIRVDDDGIGLPVVLHAGVGLHSIRERAEELGGSLTVKNLDKGTQVTAQLPLALSRKSHE